MAKLFRVIHRLNSNKNTSPARDAKRCGADPLALGHELQNLEPRMMMAADPATSDLMLSAGQSGPTQSASQDLLTQIAGPAADLTLRFTASSLPPAVQTGSPATGGLVMSLTNLGNAAAQGPVSVTIFASPSGSVDDPAAIELMTTRAASINLRPGQSTQFRARVNIPANFPEGEYRILARINSGAIAESSTANNVIEGQSLTVAAPFIKVVGQIVESRIPDTLVSGEGSRVTIPVTLTNIGNRASSRMVTVKIIATPDGDASNPFNVTIARLDQIKVTLNPGQTRTVNAIAKLPAGMAAGNYQLLAVVESDGQVGAAGIESEGRLTEQLVRIEDQGIDLAGVFGSITLPPAVITGTAVTGRVPLIVTNNGNQAAIGAITLVFQASPDGDPDNPANVTIATLANQALNLAPGRSRTYQPNVTLPAGLPEGEYVIIAKIDSTDVISEYDDDNNLVVSDAPIVVAAPFVDLVATLDEGAVPADLISGNGATTRMPLTVTNNGNTTATATIDLRVLASPDGDVANPNNVEVATLTAQRITLRPGQNRIFTASVILPEGLASGDYHFIAVADSGDALAESDEDNNISSTTAVTSVVEGVVDFGAAFIGLAIPPAILAGTAASGRATVSVTNNGNLSARASIDITFYASPNGDIDNPENLELTTLRNQALTLAPGASRSLFTTIALPASLAEGAYTIMARIDSAEAVAESDETNNVVQWDTPITIAAPFVDLVGEISEAALPAAATSGDGSKINIPVLVTNYGNRDATGAIALRAFASVDGNPDNPDNVQIALLENQTLALRPGQSKLLTLPATLPASVASGAYRIIVLVDSANAIVEGDELNNTLVTDASIAVTQGHVDLSGLFGDLALPPAVVAGTAVSGRASIVLTNNGNLPARGNIVLALFASTNGDADNPANIALGTITATALSLNPGQSRSVSGNVALPASLPQGEYFILARIDSTDLLAESDETNNTFVSQTPIVVATPFVDLAAEVDSGALPASVTAGSGVKITLPVFISNQGNGQANGSISVAIIASPDGNPDNPENIAVTTLAAQSIALRPGQGKTILASFELPPTLPGGQWRFIASVDSTNVIAESDETNNAPVSAPVLVTAGEIDLTGALGSPTLPPAIIAGTAVTGQVPVVLTNSGNIPARGNVSIAFFASTNGDIDNPANVPIGALTNQAVTLAPGASRAFTGSVTLPAGLPQGSYVILAKLDSGAAFSESNETNNVLVSAEQYTVATPFVDLEATINDALLPDSIIAGDGTQIRAGVTVVNNGNAQATGSIALQLIATTDGDPDNPDNIVIATLTGQSISLRPGASRIFQFTGQMPASAPAGVYYMLAVVDSTNAIVESDEGNNLSQSTITVTTAAGEIDLTGVLGDLSFPPAVVAGADTTGRLPLSITNSGNITARGSINIAFYASTNGDPDNPANIQIGALTNQAITLTPGSSRAFTANLTLPASLAAGEYRILARIDSANAIAESDETNNALVSGTTVLVAAPFVDLTAAVNGGAIPTDALSGSGAKITLPIEIINNGNTTANGAVTIQIIATPDGDAANPMNVILATLANQSLALRPGQIKSILATVELPASLSDGTYRLMAIVDTTNAIAENNETNNTAVSDQSVTVSQGLLDLTGQLGELSFPPALITGVAATGRVPLTLTNAGNIPLRGAISIAYFASPNGDIDNPANIALNTLTNQQVNLAPGASTQILANLTLPASLPAGSYRILARLDAANALIEGVETNNAPASADTVTLAAPFVDLSSSIAAAILPVSAISGDGTRLALPIEVINLGNTQANGTIDLRIFASTDGNPDNPENIELTTLAAQRVSLRPGQNRIFSITTTLPATLPADNFRILVETIPHNDLTDADPANNADATALSITLAAGTVNLTGQLGELTFPPAVVAGVETTGRVPLTLTNTGNIAARGAIAIAFFASPNGDIDNPANIALNTLTNQQVNLSAGQSTSILANVVLPAGLPAGEYHIVARIDSTNAIAESSETDNAVAAARTLLVAAPFVDLSGTVDGGALPASAIAGAATRITAPVEVINNGNTTATGAIEIRLLMSPDGDAANPANVTIATLANQAISLRPGTARTFLVNATLPAEIPAGTYRLLALIDSTNRIVESDESNNSPVSSQSIIIGAGVTDLVADSVATSLPPAIIAGAAASSTATVLLRNNGNLPINATLQVRVVASPNENFANPAAQTLGTADNQAIRLAPGESRSILVNLRVPASLAAGEYRLLARVDSTNVLAESDEDNNTLAFNQTLSVAAPFSDLAAAAGFSTLPAGVIAGSPLRGNLPVTLRNEGNIPMTGNVNIRVYASPNGDAANADNVLLGSLLNQAITLTPGQTRAFLPEISVPASAAQGQYLLIAVIDPPAGVTDANANNNVALSGSALTVQERVLDLQASLGAFNLPPSAITGVSTPVSVPVIITNTGNVPVHSNIAVQLLASPDGDPNNLANTLLTTLTGVSLKLNPGELKVVLAQAVLPPTMTPGSYQLLAVIDSTQLIAEQDEANNAAATGQTIAISAGSTDLSATFGLITLPRAVVAGADATGAVTVNVANNGNIPVNTNISIAFYASPDGDVANPSNILLTTLGNRPLAVPSGESRPFTAQVTLPASTPEGEYLILAVIDSTNAVAESDETNNTLVSANPIAVAAPFIDLTAEVTDSTLPQQIISGESPTGILPLIVRNNGNIPVQANIQIKIFATPDGDPANPANVLLSTLSNQSINLTPGQVKSFLAQVTMPGSIPPSDYRLMAVVDTASVVAESDETNNAAVGTRILTVGQSTVNLTGQFSQVIFPPAVIAGAPVTGNLVLSVVNGSNIALNGAVSIAFFASPDGDPANPANILLTTLANRTLGLAPGASRDFLTTVTLPANIPQGNYRFLAVIDSANVLAETNEADNAALSAASFNVAAPFVDLVAEVGVSNLPSVIIAGAAASSTLPVTVRNQGNSPVQANIQIKIVASPDGDPANPANLLLRTLENQSINLTPGQSKLFLAEFSLPAAVAAGTYTLLALTDSSNAVVESNESNNFAAGQSVTVGASVVDLAASIGAAIFPPAVIAGAPVTGSVPITVTSLSNIPVNATISIALYASPDGDPANPANVLITMLANRALSLTPGSSRDFLANITLPANMPQGNYVFLAAIDSTNALPEQNENNNTAVSVASFSVAAPFVDLVPELGVSTLPANVIAGSDASGTLPITVRNQGNSPVQANIQIKVFASPDGDPANPANLLLRTLDNQSINLTPGQTKQFLASLNIPASLPANTYQLVAVIDAAGAVAESNESNNALAAAQTFTVGNAIIDLSGSFGPVALPPAIIAGQLVQATFPITVVNSSNIPVNTVIDIALFASLDGDINNPANIPLTTLTGRALALAPNQSRDFFALVTLPANMPQGLYSFLAKIDSTNALQESNEANNVLTAAATLSVAAPFVDLAAQVGASTLPAQIIAGANATGTLPITVRNQGNSPAQANIQITVVASPDGNPANPANISLATLANQSINLTPGQTKQFLATVNIPASVPAGQYTLIALVDSANAVVESDETNNAAASGNFTVTQALIDLSGHFGPINMPPAVIAGQPLTASIPLTVSNLSNIAINSTIDLRIVASPNGVADNPANILLANLPGRSLSLTPGQTREFLAAIALPANAPQGNYTILGLIDAANSVAETNEANNIINSGFTLSIAAPFVDLAAQVGPVALPPTVIAGNAAPVNVPVTVRNQGNSPVQANIQIKVFASPDGSAANPNNFLLRTLDAQSINLTPGQQKDFFTSITLPANLPAGSYTFLAQIDSAQNVAESDETNNTAVSPTTFTLSAPLADLALQFGHMNAPAQLIAGQSAQASTSFEIRNMGNIPVSGQGSIAIYAVTGGEAPQEILLHTLANQTLNIPPNGVYNFFANFTLPANLASGQYSYRARLTTPALPDANPDNNLALSAANLTVGAAEIDLRGQFAPSFVPPAIIAGQNFQLNLPLNIQNFGNVPATGAITVVILASPNGDPANPANITLKTIANQPLNIAPGSTTTLPVNLTIPANIPQGNYTFMALIDSTNVISETNETNNTVLYAGQVAIQAAFVDVSAEFPPLSLPGSIVAGQNTAISLPVALRNNGNIPATGSFNLLIFASVDGDPQNPANILLQTLANQPMNLQPGSFQNLTANVQLPANLPQNSYRLIARVDLNSPLTDGQLQNNAAVTPGAINVQSPFIDLTPRFQPSALPPAVIAGQNVQINLPVELRNLGNIPAVGQVAIAIYASPDGSPDHPGNILLHTLTGQNVNLSANGSTFVPINLQIPATTPEGQYRFLAIITPGVGLADSNAANNAVASESTLAVGAPFVDLKAELGATSLPEQVIAGTPVTGFVPVTARNQGNVPIQGNIEVRVLASPNGDPLNPLNILLASLPNQSINLQPGQVRNFLAQVNLPASAQGGTYQIMAIIDAAGAIAEAEELNNIVISDRTLTIESATRDLVAQFGAFSVPPVLVAGQSPTFPVPVSLINTGNSPVQANVDLGLYLSPDGDPQNPLNILVGALSAFPLNMPPGASAFANFNLSIPASVPQGEYRLLARVDTGNVVAETSETNNHAVSERILAVTEPFVDLEARFTALQFPPAVIAGQNASINLPISIRNNGTSPLDQIIVINVFLSPDGNPANPENIFLNSFADMPLHLPPGMETTLPVNVVINPAVPQGNYHFLAVVDASNVITEADEQNNIVVSEQTIAIASPFVDLIVSFDNLFLPPFALAGQPTPLNLPIRIFNEGNTPAEGSVSVEFFASPDGDLENPDNIFLGFMPSQPVNIAPGQFTFIPANLQVELPVGQHRIIARIQPDLGPIQEADASNNHAVTFSTITADAATHDLAIAFNMPQFPDHVLPGQSAPFFFDMKIENLGNVPFDHSVDVVILLSPDGNPENPENFMLHQQQILLGAIPPQGFFNFPLNFGMPAVVPPGEYHFVAILGGPTLLDSNLQNNIAVVEQTITIDATEYDLVVEFDNPQFPATILAGQPVPFNFNIPVYYVSNSHLQTPVSLELFLSASGDPLDPANLLVHSHEEMLALMPVGGVFNIPVNFQLPAAALPGEYRFLARVVSHGPQEIDDLNNFAVTEQTLTIASPQTDLAVGFDNPQFPPSILMNQPFPLNFNIRVENLGNTHIDTFVNVDLFLSPDGDPENPDNLLIHSTFDQPVSAPPGGFAPIPLNFLFPAFMPGQFHFLVQLSAPGAQDTNPLNNFASTIETITLIAAQVDLAPAFDNPQFPAVITAGQPVPFNFNIRIDNLGNTQFDGPVNYGLYLSPDGSPDHPDIILIHSMLDQPLFAPSGGFANIPLNFQLPASVTPGEYHFLFHLSQSGVQETDLFNNTISTLETLTIAAPQIDLAASFEEPMLPPTLLLGDPMPLNLTLRLENLGNTFTDLPLSITILLSPDGNLENSDNFLVQQLPGQFLPIPPGGFNTLPLNFTIPAAALAGEYHIVAVVNTEAFPDSNPLNNAAITPTTITLTAPSLDLAVAFDNPQFQPNIIAGSPTPFNFNLTIENLGNSPTTTPLTISLFASPDGDPLNPLNILLREMVDQPLFIQPGQSNMFPITGMFPASATEGVYHFMAVVQAPGAVDTNPANNSTFTENTVTLAAPQIDLTIAYDAAFQMPTSITQGSTQPIQVPVHIENLGNAFADFPLLVTVHLSPDGDPANPANILVHEFNESAAPLPPGAFINLPLNIILPAIVQPGEYHLIVQVALEGAPDSNPLNNHAITPGTFEVTESSVDLTATFVNLQLPPSIGPSSPAPVDVTLDLTNLGNNHAMGMITIQLLASPTGDPHSPMNILLQSMNDYHVNLAPGMTTPVNLSFSYNAALAQGTYNLVVLIDAENFIPETNEQNNSLVSISTFDVSSGGGPIVTFDANSADLSAVPWFRGFVGRSDTFLGQEPASSSFYNVNYTLDNLLGIQTLRVDETGDPASNIPPRSTWYARDFMGRVWILKETEDNVTLFEAPTSSDGFSLNDSQDLENRLISGFTPEVGATFVDSQNRTQELVSLTASLTQFPDKEFALIRTTDPSDPAEVQYTYLHFDAGVVGRFSGDSVDPDLEMGFLLATFPSISPPDNGPHFSLTSSSLMGRPFFNGFPGRSSTYTGQGDADGSDYTVTYSLDPILGVETIKVHNPGVPLQGIPSSDIWYAQDDLGNLWKFKQELDGIVTFQAANFGELINLAASPDLADQITAGFIPAVNATHTLPSGLVQTLLSTEAALPQFPGELFTLLGIDDPNDPLNDEFLYYHPGTGLVAFFKGSNADPANDDGFVVDQLLTGGAPGGGNGGVTPNFNATSADFTGRPFVNAAAGRVDTFNGQGANTGGVITINYELDMLLGVQTLKVTEDEQGQIITSWYAIDDTFNIYLFKETEGANILFEAFTLTEARPLYSSPDLEDRLIAGQQLEVGFTLTEGSEIQEVLAIDATLPQFPGEFFTLIRLSDSNEPGQDTYAYWHIATGHVADFQGSNADPANDNGFVITQLLTIAPPPPIGPNFNADSADLSDVPFFAGFDSRSDIFTGQGVATGASYTVNYTIEPLLGIQTLKVDHSPAPAAGRPASTAWYAMDDVGAIWLFKHVLDGNILFDATGVTLLQPLGATTDLTAQLQAGQVVDLNAFMDDGVYTQTLIAIDATLPQFPGETFHLFTTVENATPANVRYAYWHADAGLVAEFMGSNADPANDDGFVIGELPVTPASIDSQEPQSAMLIAEALVETASLLEDDSFGPLNDRLIADVVLQALALPDPGMDKRKIALDDLDLDAKGVVQII